MSITKTVTYFLDNEEHEVALPAKYIVCPDCSGRGKTHLGWVAKDQPAYTQEDFDRDPGLLEDLMAGTYDATCSGCNGRTTLLVVDHMECKRSTHPLIKAGYAAWIENERDEAAYRALCDAEKRAGA
jgi:hypothetical protein